MSVSSVSSKLKIPSIFRQPVPVLKDMCGWLNGKDLARFVVACKFTSKTFSCGPHRFRVDAFNRLRIVHFNSEIIKEETFHFRVTQMRDQLPSRIETIVESECFFFLRKALSSQMMTIELRGKAVVKAASRGQLFAQNKLLANGMIFDAHRELAIKKAVKGKHHACMKMLIESNTIISHEKTRRIAMNLSVENGDSSTLQILLNNDRTPMEHRGEMLILAASRGHYSCLQAICAYGPLQGHDENLAASAAAYGGHDLCLQVLFDNDMVDKQSRGGALYRAARKGHLDCLQMLLEDGPISEDYMILAVREAASNGHLSCIQELLKRVSERPGWIDSAISDAEGKEEIIAYLKTWEPKEQKSSS